MEKLYTEVSKTPEEANYNILATKINELIEENEALKKLVTVDIAKDIGKLEERFRKEKEEMIEELESNPEPKKLHPITNVQYFIEAKQCQLKKKYL